MASKDKKNKTHQQNPLELIDPENRVAAAGGGVRGGHGGRRGSEGTNFGEKIKSVMGCNR